MARALTTKKAEAAKPAKNRQELADGIVQGLYLVVQPSGAKSWALRYRFAGKPVKLTLGRFSPTGAGGLSVAGARTEAGEALEKVERGENPAIEKKATKAAKQKAQLEGRDKIKNLLDEFDKRHLSKLKSGSQARDFLDRFILEPWGERDVQTLKKRDIIDLLDDIADSGRGTTANRLLAYIRKFLNWCVERDIIDFSPAMGVKPPAPEKQRERVLSDDEIRWLWHACDDAGQPFGPLGKLLLLTGQRRGEVGEMTESEINGDLWHLEADRTKNGRAHDVPLSQPAQAVLSGIERVRGKAGYLFTTTGDTPVSGFSKAHKIITAKMAALASKEAGEPVEIARWTWHDLRRTCATGLARLGVPVRVTEAVLNHVSGTGGGIVAVYQRHDYAAEKREALDLWARAIADIVDGRDPIEAIKLREAERRAQEAEIEAADNVVKLKA